MSAVFNAGFVNWLKSGNCRNCMLVLQQVWHSSSGNIQTHASGWAYFLSNLLWVHWGFILCESFNFKLYISDPCLDGMNPALNAGCLGCLCHTIACEHIVVWFGCATVDGLLHAGLGEFGIDKRFPHNITSQISCACLKAQRVEGDLHSAMHKTLYDMEREKVSLFAHAGKVVCVSACACARVDGVRIQSFAHLSTLENLCICLSNACHLNEYAWHNIWRDHASGPQTCTFAFAAHLSGSGDAAGSVTEEAAAISYESIAMVAVPSKASFQKHRGTWLHSWPAYSRHRFEMPKCSMPSLPQLNPNFHFQPCWGDPRPEWRQPAGGQRQTACCTIKSDRNHTDGW